MEGLVQSREQALSRRCQGLVEALRRDVRLEGVGRGALSHPVGGDGGLAQAEGVGQ